jgi:hypothetical protein
MKFALIAHDNKKAEHPSPPYPRIYGYQRVWDYVCTIYYIIWAYVRGTI